MKGHWEFPRDNSTRKTQTYRWNNYQIFKTVYSFSIYIYVCQVLHVIYTALVVALVTGAQMQIFEGRGLIQKTGHSKICLKRT